MHKFAATRWFKKLTEWARQLSDANPAVRAKAEANIRRLYNFNKQHPLRTIYTLDEPGLMQRWRDTLRRKGQFFRLREGDKAKFSRAITTITYNTADNLAHESFEYLVGAPRVRRALRRIGAKERRILLSHRAVDALPQKIYKMTSPKERVKILAIHDKHKPGYTKKLLTTLGLRVPLTHNPGVLPMEQKYYTLTSIHPDENIRSNSGFKVAMRWFPRNYTVHLVTVDPKTTRAVVLGKQKIIGANEYEASRLVEAFAQKAKKTLRRRGRRDKRYLTMARTLIWPWKAQVAKDFDKYIPQDIYPVSSNPISILRALHHKHKPTVTTKWYWDNL